MKTRLNCTDRQQREKAIVS